MGAAEQAETEYPLLIQGHSIRLRTGKPLRTFSLAQSFGRSIHNGRHGNTLKPVTAILTKEKSTIANAGPRELLDIALEYWRGGEFKEAIAVVDSVETGDPEIRFETGLARAVILSEAGKYKDALRMLAKLDLDTAGPRLKGRFYGQRACVKKKLGKSDEAIVDYSGAQTWCAEAGDYNYEAAVSNNLASLHRDAGRYPEAYESVDHAIGIFIRLCEHEHLAKAYDQKAQIHLEEKNYVEAVRVARTSVALLQDGDRFAWLAESLITLGRALAGCEMYADARKSLEKAAEICEHVGDVNQAATAYVTLLTDVYLRTAPMDHFTAFRLRNKIASELHLPTEKQIVQEALAQANNNFTNAAKLLGISHTAIIKAAGKHHISRKKDCPT